MVRTTNPYNPYNFKCEFNINIVEEDTYKMIKDAFQKKFKVKTDDIIVLEVILFSLEQ
jgi:hypothetical protein